MSENVACSKLFIFMLCNVQAKDNYCKPFFFTIEQIWVGRLLLIEVSFICIYLIKNLTQDDIFAKRWFSHMQSALLICHVWIFFVKIGPCWNILCIQIMLHSENQKLVFQKKIYCMYHSRLRIVMYNGDLFCVCHKEKRRHRMIWC